MQFTDPTDIAQPYWIKANFTLEPLTNMPGRGGLAVPVGLAPGQIAGTGSNMPDAVTNLPTRCDSSLVEERYSLSFPANVSIDAVPKGTRFERGDIRYESSFAQNGSKVTVHRTLRVQRASNICGEKEGHDWLAFYKVLRRDLRSQIIYR